MNLFDLAAKITLDTGDYEKGITDALSGAQKLAGAIGNGLANAAKVGMAAVASAMAGIGAVTKSAVEGFGEYEQLVGGVETLFKGSAGVVQKYAANAYKTAGMSANDYMDTVTSFSASLLQSLGGDTAQAADIADMAITDMSDNANKMGTDMAAIQYAYQGFAKQNYTMLDNLKLGYGGTQAEMLRLLDTANEINAQQGIITDYQISNFADIVDAIHVVQTEIGITGTTMAEASGTIQGSISAMKSAWQNLIAGLANPDADMSVLVSNFAESFEIAFDNIQPAIETALINIGDVIAKIAPTILDKLPDLGGALLDSLANVVESVTGIDLSPLTDGLKNALGVVLDMIREIGSAFAEGGIDGAIESLFTQLGNLTGLDLSGVSDMITGLLDAFKSVGAAFAEGGISGAIESIYTQLSNLTGLDLSVISDEVTGLFDAISAIGVAFLEGGISGALDEMTSAFERMTGLDLTPIIDGISTYITKFKEDAPAAMEHFRGAVDRLKEALDYIGLTDIIQKVIDLVGGLIASFDGAVVIDFMAYAIEAFAKGLETAHDWVLKAGEAIKTFFTVTIPEAAKNISTSLGEKIDEISKFFKEDIPNAISEAVEAIKSKVSDFIQAGRDLINGFVQGIKDKISDAVSAVKEAAGNVVDGIKNVLGIHSPSRVFAEIGKNLILGLEQGFDSEFRSAEKSMLGSFDSLVGGMNGTARINFVESGIGKASAGTVNGIVAAASSQGGGNYNINLVVDGKTLASVVYDPLNKISRQKGDGVYA